MADVMYEKTNDPTPAQIEAARAYSSESGFFHLACQADHSMALVEFGPFQSFCQSGKLLALKQAASSCFPLTADALVYSGHGNGVGVVGGLGHSGISYFKQMTWRYRGFTSTTSRKDKAEHFVATRAKVSADVPVFLEFRLPTGFFLFPMETLGSDRTDEAEFLLPPQSSFKIIEASRIPIGRVRDVVHFVLVPSSRRQP
ncbi:MAG TPA: hypothetical protein VGG99_18955 [Acetobacteraceae bacterium]|jgi:hypothetical protein